MSNEIESGNTLSDGQEKALSLVYTFSSLLSLMGSSTIVYKVVSNRSKATSYDRLMLGLSTSDILGSIGYGLYPYFGPHETSPRVWAIGSDATCSALGVFTQIGFTAALYNGFLSFYYLFIIRYGTSRKDFARRYEPSIHATTILFSLVTTIVGAAKGFYSEVQVGMGCWVNNYPPGCVEDCISDEIGWVYGGLPIFFALLSLVVNNILVFLHVRRVFGTRHVVETERTIRQKMQTREVATQGFLYVFNWFFCFWAPMTVRLIESFSYTAVDESNIYWLLLCQAATLPLQGFLNMFVYNRPNYQRIRAAYPKLSFLATIQKACLDSNIPKLAEITKLSGTRVPSKDSSRMKRENNNSNNKMKNHRSGSAFSSDLAGIPEGNEEESSELNLDLGGPRLAPNEDAKFDAMEHCPNENSLPSGSELAASLHVIVESLDCHSDEEFANASHKPYPSIAGRYKKANMDGSIDEKRSIITSAQCDDHVYRYQS